MNQLCMELSNIKVLFGLRTILSIDRWELYDTERVGLVGENGAGKTTLLKLLAGELAPDEGTVTRRGEVSFIRQYGETERAIVNRRLAGEFSAPDPRTGLSGGEKTRRRIADALSQNTRVLLADEPTTDLDHEGIALIEKKLKAYDGAVVLVSHDRALLNAVCNVIWELQDGVLTKYPGSYTAYREEKQKRLAFSRFEYDQYRDEQKRIRTMIQREVEHASQKQKLPTRMGNSEARLHKREVTNTQKQIHKTRKSYESRLERLTEKQRPREDVEIRMALGAFAPVVSKTAVEIRGLTIGFGDNTLLKNADMVLPTGAKCALLGKNGCGKTTLTRVIQRGGNERARVSPGVRIGYFGQDHEEVLALSRTALDNVMATNVYDESTARTVLARLNLRGDDVFKRAEVLSGGERAKICLARLFVSDANLLILDEPTNHLDIFTLEALQRVILEYAGTVLLVSHDRTFVENTADRLVFFENRQLRTFAGGMAAWREAEKKREAGDARAKRDTEITILQMRMAALSARMAAPKKGDDPEKLNEEYLSLGEQARLLQAQSD